MDRSASEATRRPPGRGLLSGGEPPGCPFNNRYGKEEHAARGVALYDREVRPRLEARHEGQIVALDVDSGADEVAEDTLTAAQRLWARCPQAQMWCVRVGRPAVHRFGPRMRPSRA